MAVTGTEKRRADTPRDRLVALSPERQAQLLDPAEAEFAANGFERASLNRILAAAGMSKGQAYYYFADKADLYCAVVDRAVDRLVAAMDIPLPEPPDVETFWQQVRDVLLWLTAQAKSDDRLAGLARSIYESEKTGKALEGPLARIRALLERATARGQSVGAIRTDFPQSLLTGVLFAMALEIDRWFAEHWSELDTGEALRLTGEAIGLIRAAAAPPASPVP